MKPRILKPDSGAEFETPERCSILESWNDGSDPSVSIARARVKPGVITQLHRLRGVDERYLVISGSGIVRIGGLEPQRVRPGDVVVIPAGVPQQISNDRQQDLVFYCICSPRFASDCYEAIE